MPSLTRVIALSAFISSITISCTTDEIHEFQDLGRKVNEKKAKVDSTLEKVSDGLRIMDEFLQDDESQTQQDSVDQKEKTPEFDSSGL